MVDDEVKEVDGDENWRAFRLCLTVGFYSLCGGKSLYGLSRGVTDLIDVLEDSGCLRWMASQM